MLGFIQRIMRRQRGQALPAVLALLVIGGLTIAPALDYSATTLNGSRIVSEDIRGIYAADAGIAEALWALENGQTPPTQTSDNINQMAVSIQTVETGNITLYLGELVEPGEHNDYLDIDGTLVWDDPAGAYKYTITVTWLPGSGYPIIHLEEVGARMPIGYTYQPGSAAGFAENLSTDEPDEVLDSVGAYLLNWVLDTPLPEVSESDPVATQTFYITGSGSLENHYAWVVASREDIGAVGEIAGYLYQISANATRLEDGVTTARIVADVIVEQGVPGILSWHVSN